MRSVRRRFPAPLRGLWGATTLLALALCAVLAAVPGSSAAFTARVVNTTDTVATNPYFTCQAAVRADGGRIAKSAACRSALRSGIGSAAWRVGCSAVRCAGRSRPARIASTAARTTTTATTPVTRSRGRSANRPPSARRDRRGCAAGSCCSTRRTRSSRTRSA